MLKLLIIGFKDLRIVLGHIRCLFIGYLGLINGLLGKFQSILWHLDSVSGGCEGLAGHFGSGFKF